MIAASDVDRRRAIPSLLPRRASAIASSAPSSLDMGVVTYSLVTSQSVRNIMYLILITSRSYSTDEDYDG